MCVQRVSSSFRSLYLRIRRMPAPPFDPRPIVLRGRHVTLREGVLRRHRIGWDAHVRDTVSFGVTDLDWPRVREGLLARLAPR